MKALSLLFSWIILLIFVAGWLPQLARAEELSSPLDNLIQKALEENPELKTAEARWHLYERKIVPARSLDDPRLSFTFSNYPVDSFSGDETPMTGKELGLSQTFPFPGKLAAKGEMAEQEALWYKGVYDDGRLQLIRKVKDSWYRLFFQDKAIEITNKNIALLDDFIRLTETRYQVGKGLQQDVLKAQVERSRLMDRLFTLKQQRETILADLNTLLARPTSTPVETPEGVEMTPVDLSLEDLQKKAEENRPLFASYNSLVDQFKAQKHLADLNYWPDFTVSAAYRFRESVQGDPAEGTDFASAGVSFNLPIWREKRHEAVAEAESGVRMAHDRYADFRNRVSFNLHDTYARMEKDRDLVSLYKTGILPQADQTFQSTLTAYQVGKVDFLSLLDSLLKLYNYQTDYYRVLADYRRDVAGLEAEAGVDLIRASAVEPQ
jgi:cobalt-zinc-cadmium efflux system outer membrane protein